jgi:hypothetical protein
VPTSDAGLKVLVLDDPLISLDASHRYPVLNAITELFADWQIILLTHDREWFEAAREKLPSEQWQATAIFETTDGNNLLVPLIRPLNDNSVEDMLKQAEAFLADKHFAAAANYARSACELTLRHFCHKQAVKFVYFSDSNRPDLNTLLQTAIPATQGPRRVVLENLEQHKRYVLNPLSHDPLKPIPEDEVTAAIAAVRQVVLACAKNYP